MAQEEALSLDDLVEALRPHLRDLVETIAISGSATTGPDGKRVPGDVRAASIGLELVSKYLAGRGSDRAASILKEALKLQAADHQSATSPDRPDEPNGA